MPDIFSVDKRIVTCVVDDFAVNRTKRSIAFAVFLGVNEVKTNISPRMAIPIMQFGAIYFLPKVGLSADETLRLVLRDMCGVELGLPEPPWAADLVAPGQGEVDAEIDALEARISKLRDELSAVQARRVKVRQPLKLLYEREYDLEPVVRDVLRSLGADVEDPVEPNKEDGWITVTVDGTLRLGVLEIKSTRRDQLGEDGIGQAVQWRSRTIESRSQDCKAIFIGNSAVDKEPSMRQDPFSDSWRRNTKFQHVAAIRAEDLYAVYALDQLGRLDRNQFWREVFETNGVVDLREYLDPLDETES